MFYTRISHKPYIYLAGFRVAVIHQVSRPGCAVLVPVALHRQSGQRGHRLARQDHAGFPPEGGWFLKSAEARANVHEQRFVTGQVRDFPCARVRFRGLGTNDKHTHAARRSA